MAAVGADGASSDEDDALRNKGVFSCDIFHSKGIFLSYFFQWLC